MPLKVAILELDTLYLLCSLLIELARRLLYLSTIGHLLRSPEVTTAQSPRNFRVFGRGGHLCNHFYF